MNFLSIRKMSDKNDKSSKKLHNIMNLNDSICSLYKVQKEMRLKLRFWPWLSSNLHQNYVFSNHTSLSCRLITTFSSIWLLLYLAYCRFSNFSTYLEDWNTLCYVELAFYGDILQVLGKLFISQEFHTCGSLNIDVPKQNNLFWSLNF